MSIIIFPFGFKTLRNSEKRYLIFFSDPSNEITLIATISSKLLSSKGILFASFLRSKNSKDLILKGWNEYFSMYLSKRNLDISLKESKLALKNLNEKDYVKFKEIQSKYRKKTF